MKRTSPDLDAMLDQLLESHLGGTHEELEPSSGFVMSVMDTIQARAAEPPPIPFPWRRILPGLLAVLGGLIVLTLILLRTSLVRPQEHAHQATSLIQTMLESTRAFTAGQLTLCWVLVAACLSVVAVAASFRLAGRRQ